MYRNMLLGGASVAALVAMASVCGLSPAQAAINPTCAANGGTIGGYPYSPTTGDVIVCTATGIGTISNASANNVQLTLANGMGTLTNGVTLGNNASFTVNSGAELNDGAIGKGTAFQSGTGLTALILSGGTVTGGITAGSGSTITVAGTVAKFAGAGTAIGLTGDNNQLILNPGFTISGGVTGGTSGATNTTLELGVTGSGTFNASLVASTFTNFAKFEKTGSSTWTLTGVASPAVTPWTISGGTLSIASDLSLGVYTQALTINGGTLALTANTGMDRAIVIGANGGTISPAASVTTTLYGVVSGSGPLTIAGAGTVQLTVPETYSGTLTINSGSRLTLVANEGILNGSLASASLVDNGTFDISAITTSGSTIASLSGSGTVALGSKTLTVTNGSGIFTGTMTGTAPITITGGQLSVNGTAQQTIAIASGGTLRGIGTVGGFTANGGGTVAPGNSIGTLNVAGNFSFASGSIYQVEVNAAGASDKIIATGTATIASGAAVNVVAAAGTYAANTNYTIITATGGVTGTFSTVTSNLAFLQPSLS